TWRTLKLKGKIALMKGNVPGAVEAIAPLERARDMLRQLNPNRKVRDWELEFLLASAYFDNHQTGLAKTLLFEIKDAVPTFVPAKKMLLRLLIADHESEMTSQLLKDLETLAPNDPDLPRLKAASYATGDRKISVDDVAKALQSMPEE